MLETSEVVGTTQLFQRPMSEAEVDLGLVQQMFLCLLVFFSIISILKAKRFVSKQSHSEPCIRLRVEY